VTHVLVVIASIFGISTVSINNRAIQNRSSFTLLNHNHYFKRVPNSLIDKVYCLKCDFSFYQLYVWIEKFVNFKPQFVLSFDKLLNTFKQHFFAFVLI